jgi:putative transposase
MPKGSGCRDTGELEVILEGVINKTYLQDTIPAVSVVVSRIRGSDKREEQKSFAFGSAQDPKRNDCRRYRQKLDPYFG